MIYLSTSNVVHSQSFKNTMQMLGIPFTGDGRRFRTPAQNRMVGAVLTACRLGRTVVLHNLNEDVCVIFQGSFVKLARQQKEEWRTVNYSFAIDWYADPAGQTRRLPE